MSPHAFPARRPSVAGHRAFLVALAAVAGLLPSCARPDGDAGTGFRILASVVERTEADSDEGRLYASAEAVDWEVPLAGGSGGPYVARVIAGGLPPGVQAVDAGGPRLRGVLLAEGTFRFRLEVLDRGVAPFRHAWADLAWTVRRGRVRIVAAEPAFDGRRIPSAVYGEFTVRRFVVAGGLPPYALEVGDDPATTRDGPLPLGTAIPPAATSIVGAPLEIRPDGSPFLLTLVAVDAAGERSEPRPVEWQVVAPPLVLTTHGLPDGRCGTRYAATLEVQGGVPPLRFRLVASDVTRTPEGAPAVGWRSGEPPEIAPPAALEAIGPDRYPATDDPGPDYRACGVPPEGICLGDVPASPFAAAGSFAGVPRRRGEFRFVVHAASGLVPDLPQQQDWRPLALRILASEASPTPEVPFAPDPGIAGEAAFPDVPPYAEIPEAEVGVAYNPDAATHPPLGLQLRAVGGVRKDGRSDAPVASAVRDLEGLGTDQEDAETPGGGYDWEVRPLAPDDRTPGLPLPRGMVLDGWLGLWRAEAPGLLTFRRPAPLAFTVRDQQLPLQARNEVTVPVRFGVGPDRVVVTESTTPGTSATGASAWDRNDNRQSVRMCLPYLGAPPVVRDLDARDLSPTHGVPAATGLGGPSALATLLANQDLLRVTVNPSGWWDDLHGLHPAAARPGQHADRNGFDHYMTGEVDRDAATDLSRQPSATAVALPALRPGPTPVVPHDPARGLFTDGGRLYAFQNEAYFGVFVVRSDGTLYVPFAASRTVPIEGTLYAGFGDGVALPYAPTGRSQLRVVHLAVSPDGRFGALKVKTRETDVLETAETTPLVLVSLCGERCFAAGGTASTWCLVRTGAGGVPATGVYLYGPGVVLTNSHLYALCGNLAGTGNVEAPSRSHFVYRLRFADPATGAVVAGPTATATLLPAADPEETGWTNAPGAPLQTRYQVFAGPLASGTAGAFAMTMDGMNLLENSLAPLPFRVSADGRAVAILAMADQAKPGPLRQAWHVWVDFEGRGARRLSTAPRHVTGGATRGYTLGRGDRVGTYENWHRFGGPTPHLEISDDASKVAVVVNRFAGTPTFSSPTTSWPREREDVIAYRTEDQVVWREIPVTGDGAGRAVFSAASGFLWRFGCLAFTRDGAGLVFWGGASSYHPTGASATAQYSHLLTGTLYGADLSEARDVDGVLVTGLLAAEEGGAAVGIRSFTTSTPFDPAPWTQTYSAALGVVKPYGGFLSPNRAFLYLVNKGGLAPGGGAEHRLVGVNLRSADPSRSVNGHPDFRAFAVPGWPARRGFLAGSYGTNAQYGLHDTEYPAWRRWGLGLQVPAGPTGWVLWGSHHQTTGPLLGTGTSVSGGPLYPTYGNDYGAYGGEVEAFHADVGGGVVRLSAFGSDLAVRRLHAIFPSEDGRSLAFVFDTFGATNASAVHEQLHALTGVDLDETGAPAGAPRAHALEPTPGRISDALAFGPSGDRLYYAAAEPSDEATGTLREARLARTGGPPSIRSLSSLRRRWNVLSAGR